MNENQNKDFRRNGDYADLPRSLAWIIISIKEVGLPAVVIGALLWITFANQEHMTTALTSVSVMLTKLDSNDQRAFENHRIIIDNQKYILQQFGGKSR